jgi:hypothetical protein
MARYSHRLIWTFHETRGALAGLDLVRDYPCRNNVTTARHMAQLMTLQSVAHVHLIAELV